MLIDSHCHLDYIVAQNSADTIASILERAKAAGVQHFLTVYVELSQVAQLRAIAHTHACVDYSVGVHPNDVHDDAVVHPDALIALANDEKVLAFGETGLDYFRSDASTIAAQKQSFVHHIEAAKTLGKPLILHIRDAFDDVLPLLKNNQAHKAGGVLHCFTGTYDQALAAIDLGFYISFSGIVTFKNARELQQVAAELPLERMLVETDSPYLAPMPHRGKTNEPAYVHYVAEKIAQLQNTSYEAVAATTTANFKQLFRPSQFAGV